MIYIKIEGLSNLYGILLSSDLFVYFKKLRGCPYQEKKKLSLPILLSLCYFWAVEFVGVKSLNKVTGTEK